MDLLLYWILLHAQHNNNQTLQTIANVCSGCLIFDFLNLCLSVSCDLFLNISGIVSVNFEVEWILNRVHLDLIIHTNTKYWYAIYASTSIHMRNQRLMSTKQMCLLQFRFHSQRFIYIHLFMCAHNFHNIIPIVFISIRYSVIVLLLLYLYYVDAAAAAAVVIASVLVPYSKEC